MFNISVKQTTCIQNYSLFIEFCLHFPPHHTQFLASQLPAVQMQTIRNVRMYVIPQLVHAGNTWNFLPYFIQNIQRIQFT